MESPNPKDSLSEEIISRSHVGELMERFLGKPNSLRAHLVKSATGVFVLKIISAGLVFGSSILLARLLGVAGYGVYVYAWTSVMFLSILATFGLPQLLVRNLASYNTRSEWGLIRGLLRFADRTVLATSIVLVLFLAFAIWIFSEHLTPQTATTFLIALPAFPLIAILRMRQMALQGFNQIVQGQILESFIRPALFLILLLSTYFILGRDPSESWSMGMQVIAIGIAFFISILILQKYIPDPIRRASCSFETRAWVQSALSLLLIGLLQLGNQYADILMLGPIRGSEAVGIYKVAFQASLLIIFALEAVNVAIGPTIASMYTRDEKKMRLQRLITRGTRATLFISLPLALIFILAGQWTLLVLFGQEYIRGATTLALLTVGQLVNLIVGPVHRLLIMTGYERKAIKGWVLATGINISLNSIFIPIWGIEGAALATVISIVVWNILLAVWVHRELGIYPTVLGSNLRRIQQWLKRSRF